MSYSHEGHEGFWYILSQSQGPKIHGGSFSWEFVRCKERKLRINQQEQKKVQVRGEVDGDCY